MIRIMILLPYFLYFVDYTPNERARRKAGNKDKQLVACALNGYRLAFSELFIAVQRDLLRACYFEIFESPEFLRFAAFSNPVLTGPGQSAVTVMP